MTRWADLTQHLDAMVNQWYETAEIRRMLTVPLTPARLAFRHVHMTFFSNNRRDCWAAVSSKAPLDVKRAIWEHEKDELIFDPRMGKAHVTEEDLGSAKESDMIPGARAAFYAWIYCATAKPWLEALACSHILERRNNEQIVKGGTLTQRLVKRQELELGIKRADQDIGTQVHLVADVEHSDLLEEVFRRYVVDDSTAQQVLRGAEESLAIERCFHGAIATAMAELD
ncbi:MAG TPA: hypothetical protein VHM64_04770 [Candidatus Binatia bacterium]|nr:hypothetical protein [Candidatus Binatia bacterium]